MENCSSQSLPIHHHTHPHVRKPHPPKPEEESSSAGNPNIDIANYSNVNEIYREIMSPTSIVIASKPGSDEKVAIKRIFKDELVTDFQRRQAAFEFPIHCSLSHRSLITGFKWSENEKEYIMEMEFMNSATYFQEKIDVNLSPVKNEAKIKSYMRNILEGLVFLHSKGIVHGDIKLENILVHKGEKGTIPIVKLCDLGLSRVLDKETGKFYMESPVGSIQYMAPEIKAHSYLTEKIDMWSLGLVLYKMSVAYKPIQVTGYKYGKGPLPFRRFDWKNRSQDLQDLITKMLEIDPEKRISAEEALKHPWFQN